MKSNLIETVKSFKLRTWRIISQSLFLVLFMGLFFFVNKFPHAYGLDSNWFLKLNPLTAFLVTIASRGVVTSIVIWGGLTALLTLIFGRFFCGFVCPLGSAIDISDKLLFPHTSTRRPKVPVSLHRLKYALLLVIVVIALFGVLFPLFYDPISLMTRFCTILINPLLAVFKIDAVEIGTSLLHLTGQDNFLLATRKVPIFYTTFATAILALAVVAGGTLDKRFWCQYVCPSGAFFGMLSRLSLFHRTRGTCNSCGACHDICPTHAIVPENPSQVRISECIVCGLCSNFKNGCSTFRFEKPTRKTMTGPDVKRRDVLTGLAASLFLIPTFRSSAIEHRDDHGQLIRPPGAIPEKEFAARCLACGQCMKACPTNAIQPCTFNDGFHRIYTPKIVPRIAGCEEKCHLCGYVCPTGAIRRLSHDQKQFVKIGTAVLARDRCLAWTQNKECLVCDEVCPYNAIEAKMIYTTKGVFKVPVVNEDLCLGCGMCEQHCPIFDKAAIEVFKFGEHRITEGSYVSDWQKTAILEKRRQSDSSLYGSEPHDPHGSFDNDYESGNKENSPGLPPGFIE